MRRICPGIGLLLAAAVALCGCTGGGPREEPIAVKERTEKEE